VKLKLPHSHEFTREISKRISLRERRLVKLKSVSLPVDVIGIGSIVELNPTGGVLATFSENLDYSLLSLAQVSYTVQTEKTAAYGAHKLILSEEEVRRQLSLPHKPKKMEGDAPIKI